MEAGLPLLDIRILFPSLTETLDFFAVLDGGSLPTDIALLKQLSKTFDNCTYFEIGTWRGESAVNVAGNCSECYTLNLSREELISMGLNEKYADMHGFFSKSYENIKHLTGNSMNFDFQSLNKKFDLIFIDGDHHYDFVKNDTEKVFGHLIHENSIIVWHDYAFNPEKPRHEVMAAILDGTPPEYHKFLYHVSNTLCAVFMRKELPVSLLNSPVTPDKIFTVNFEIRNV
jgi:predicted O-methyltransferase YrrM